MKFVVFCSDKKVQLDHIVNNYSNYRTTYNARDLKDGIGIGNGNDLIDDGRHMQKDT